LKKGFGLHTLTKWAQQAIDDSLKLYKSYCQKY